MTGDSGLEWGNCATRSASLLVAGPHPPTPVSQFGNVRGRRDFAGAAGVAATAEAGTPREDRLRPVAAYNVLAIWRRLDRD